MLCESKIFDMLNAAFPDTHEYKIALYSARLDPLMTKYEVDNEHVGAGYEPGGADVGKPVLVKSGDIVSIVFEKPEVEWLNADIEAVSSLLYDATTGDAIRVDNFDRKRGVFGGMFSVGVGEAGEILSMRVVHHDLREQVEL